VTNVPVIFWPVSLKFML